jgi:hypothetical protein
MCVFGFFYHDDQHVRCFTAYLYFYYIRQCKHHSEIINNALNTITHITTIFRLDDGTVLTDFCFLVFPHFIDYLHCTITWNSITEKNNHISHNSNRLKYECACSVFFTMAINMFVVLLHICISIISVNVNTTLK